MRALLTLATLLLTALTNLIVSIAPIVKLAQGHVLLEPAVLEAHGAGILTPHIACTGPMQREGVFDRLLLDGLDRDLDRAADFCEQLRHFPSLAR